MIFPRDIADLSSQIIRLYAAQGKKIVTAESCTGGLIGAALTAIPGSSEVYERGFVSYSYEAKTELLGVLPDVLVNCGAVSAEVAEAMAIGALEFSQADVAVSVTGIAGPGGATPTKPVGLVYFGLTSRDGAPFHMECRFNGTRDEVRHQSAVQALQLLLSYIKSE